MDYSFLKSVKTIAVVGISDKPERSSYGVAEYLTNHYNVIPVNPNLKTWKGIPCYPNLKSIPVKIDLVDIFRRSEEVLPIVEEAILVGVPVIWMQLGVINDVAAEKAKAHGITVVMDECLAVVDRLNR